ncbi:hypothetical protein PTSG_09255 [Salpingoeca rosetta]|uniref:Succinate dehydrogenase assembly factor 4, mitochondrial n=1 Tax=Salpingoeca rosetta (strain ATCC 50818 / BSB-021) TaxID=946362 RepID=F2UN62_SALR5|nr:uncharacterized protein PTSG_09255 [Salpingoeca rosetta]EGD78561.1 hypothetical protein PTSG_09255 [Salpingoeca rosetta]|eukprot:XP_004989510.1 hypothetical protein PTSG_09255 [Salpingoeca rosetta]
MARLLRALCTARGVAALQQQPQQQALLLATHRWLSSSTLTLRASDGSSGSAGAGGGEAQHDNKHDGDGNGDNKKAKAPSPHEVLKQKEGEQGGPKGPEPTRYGDWERKGRVSDF